MGQATDAFVPVMVAGVVLVVALGIAALSYMRAVDAVAGAIREKKPSGWEIGLLDGSWYEGNPRPLFTYWWISFVVMGARGLDVPGDEYRKLLRTARMRLLICFILFVIFLIGLGWFTRGTMHAGY